MNFEPRIYPPCFIACRAAALCLLLALVGAPLYAQNNVPDPRAGLPDAPSASTRQTSSLRTLPRDLLRDQAAIWTSPVHLRESNAVGPVVLVLATTLAITVDHQAMSSSRLQNSSLNQHANTASNGLVGAFIAAPLAYWGLGHLAHNEQATEAGILGGEAILDSLAVNEAIKGISRRERPTADGARGKFFQSGVGLDSSFASNHSVIAWSSSAVLASEYPGWLSKCTFYGMALGTSATRVMARQHFPSDVLVGSAVGWMVGRYVFHRHTHNSSYSYGN